MNKAKKLARALMHRTYREALITSVAPALEHERVVRHLEVRTLIDVGANKGQFSLVVARCHPEAGIFAFEPLAGPAARFRRVFSADSRVQLTQVAIGPEAGEVQIHVSRREDSSSLLPIGHLQERNFPGTGERAKERIRTARLADVLERYAVRRPCLMKIDVQGYELEALRGSEELLDLVDAAIVECSFVELYEGQALAHEVVDYLHARGLRLGGVYNLSCDREGLPVQADFLFRRAG